MVYKFYYKKSSGSAIKTKLNKLNNWLKNYINQTLENLIKENSFFI